MLRITMLRITMLRITKLKIHTCTLSRVNSRMYLEHGDAEHVGLRLMICRCIRLILMM
jgi:hypothetical protein